MDPLYSSNRPFRPLHPPKFSGTTDQQKMAEVVKAIDELNAAAYELSPGKPFTSQLLALIAKAQTAANAGNWDDAHNAVWQGVFLINRAVESKNSLALQILLVFAPLLTVFALLLFKWVMDQLYDHQWISLVVQEEYFPFLWTGAIGGTTVAYWGLVKHSGHLDFDVEYLFWYCLKPLLGAIMAGIAVLTIKAGLFTIQGSTTTTNDLPLYVMAFLAGFSERFFIDLIDRVLGALFGGQTPDNVSKPAGIFSPSSVTPSSAGSGSQNGGGGSDNGGNGVDDGGGAGGGGGAAGNASTPGAVGTSLNNPSTGSVAPSPITIPSTPPPPPPIAPPPVVPAPVVSPSPGSLSTPDTAAGGAAAGSTDTDDATPAAG